MPELPEVETIRRQLEPELRGRRIESAEVLDQRWTRPVPPAEVEQALAGRLIEQVERRGKYLVLRLDGGRSLAMHLRMTGNLLLDHGEATPAPPPPAGGDPARGRRAPCCSRMHADSARPWSWTATASTTTSRPGSASSLCRRRSRAQELCRLAAGRRAPLKSFLLNQSGIAGIGNIYADEALHRAALHPLSPAGSMKPEDCERLREGIVATLEAGLRSGGASVDDYLDARGERGAMQEEFLVHTREGEPCPRCGAEIRRIVVAGRSTYFCPSCQRRLRRRPRRRARRRSAG